MNKVIVFLMALCLSAAAFTAVGDEKPAAPAAAAEAAAPEGGEEDAKTPEAEKKVEKEAEEKAEKADKAEKKDGKACDKADKAEKKDGKICDKADKAEKAERVKDKEGKACGDKAEKAGKKAKKAADETAAAPETDEDAEETAAVETVEDADEVVEITGEAAAIMAVGGAADAERGIFIQKDCHVKPERAVQPVKGRDTRVGVRFAGLGARASVKVYNDVDTVSNGIGYGFEAGIVALHQHLMTLDFSFGVNLISRRVINVDENTLFAKYDEFAVGIPITAQWFPFIGIGLPIYLEAGPQIEFTLSLENDESLKLDDSKRSGFDLGVVVGLGGHIGNHFAIDVRAVIGTMEIYDGLKNGYLYQYSVGLSYLF
jgi:hypothetical protein